MMTVDDGDYARLTDNGVLRTDPPVRVEPCGDFFVGVAVGTILSSFGWLALWWLL